MRPLNWHSLSQGRLALWPRPQRRAIPLLGEAGCTLVATLLCEREGALAIGQLVQEAGLQWVWLPRPNSAPPLGKEAVQYKAGIYNLAGLLEQGVSLLVHCSAGIHRTGTVGYALLRIHGYAQEEALEALREMRPEIVPLTDNQGLTAQHIGWVEEYCLM